MPYSRVNSSKVYQIFLKSAQNQPQTTVILFATSDNTGNDPTSRKQTHENEHTLHQLSHQNRKRDASRFALGPWHTSRRIHRTALRAQCAKSSLRRQSGALTRPQTTPEWRPDSHRNRVGPHKIVAGFTEKCETNLLFREDWCFLDV